MTDSLPTRENPLVPNTAPRLALVPRSGKGDGQRIICRRAVTLIGSRDGCKLRLQSAQVDPVHVAIVQTGGAVFAIDLVTQAGTYLNDLRLEHEMLTDGDVIRVGPWSFAVELTPSTHETVSDLVVDLEPSAAAFAIEHLESNRLLKPNREVCLIGRRAGCDIVVSDHSVSRVHAVLLNFENRRAICDLVSRNGIEVDGQPCTFHFLSDQVVLTIGEVKFLVREITTEEALQKVNGHSPSRNGAAAPTPAEPSTAPPPASEEDIAQMGKVLKPSEPLRASATERDLIDIQETEGSQRWVIVDHLKKVERGERDGSQRKDASKKPEAPSPTRHPAPRE